MNLRPRGGRVIIKPEQAADFDERSGLHLAKAWEPEQRGTVVAITPANHARAAELATRLAMRYDCEFDAMIGETVNFLRELAQEPPAVKPGDDVLFSWQAGQELWIDEGRERLLILREEDLLAVVEP